MNEPCTFRSPSLYQEAKENLLGYYEYIPRSNRELYQEATENLLGYYEYLMELIRFQGYLMIISTYYPLKIIDLLDITP